MHPQCCIIIIKSHQKYSLGQLSVLYNCWSVTILSRIIMNWNCHSNILFILYQRLITIKMHYNLILSGHRMLSINVIQYTLVVNHCVC